jgi:hypothetical protein
MYTMWFLSAASMYCLVILCLFMDHKSLRNKLHMKSQKFTIKVRNKLHKRLIKLNIYIYIFFLPTMATIKC